MRYALASDVGVVRQNNEDSALAIPERGLFVVADGMGGHVAGEVASRVAVDSFVASVLKEPRPKRVKDELPILEAAAHAANDAVLDAALANGLAGMGTTLTGLLVHGRTAVVVHVGDSRAYLCNRKLRTLTDDHTMAALMVQNGVLSETEAEDHPERHVLTQAVGTARRVDPDVLRTRIPPGGKILLCTDGLYDVVPSAEILSRAHGEDLDAAVKSLVDCANEHGGPDNITVLLVAP